MSTLHWVFSNGHKWHKDFGTMQEAEDYAHTMGLFADPRIVRAWIDVDSGKGTVWLKEKAQA
jgi:hypothetical protein